MAVNPLAKDRWFEAVADCEAFVCTALNKDRDAFQASVQSFRQAHPVHFTWVDRSWNWGGPTIINNYAPAAAPAAQRPQSEQEKKDAAARIALLVGGILSLVGAGLVGYFYTRLGGEYETVQWVHEIQGRTEDFKGASPNVVKLFNLRAKVHEQNYENIRNQFLCSATLLGGSLALVAGGLTVAPLAITAGWVAVFAGSVFAMLNLGLHWADGEKMDKLCAQMDKVLPDALGELQLVFQQQQDGAPPPYYNGLGSYLPEPPAPPL